MSENAFLIFQDIQLENSPLFCVCVCPIRTMARCQGIYATSRRTNPVCTWEVWRFPHHHRCCGWKWMSQLPPKKAFFRTTCQSPKALRAKFWNVGHWCRILLHPSVATLDLRRIFAFDVLFCRGKFCLPGCKRHVNKRKLHEWGTSTRKFWVYI